MKKFLASLLLMVFIAPLALQADEVKSKFFYDFSESITGWKLVDRDNDGRNWLFSEEGYIYSVSADTIKPNNIITTVDKYSIYATSKISFDVRPETDKNIEKYGIGVVYSLDGETFTTLQDETALESATEWNTVEISLSHIAGKEVYIGILHSTQDDQGTILVDNVKLVDGKLPTAENVVIALNNNNVDVTWNAPTEESANKTLSGYRVYQRRNNGSPVKISNDLTETSYQDTKFADAKWGIYNYGVAALYQTKTRGDVTTLLEEGFETTKEGIIPEGWSSISDPESAVAGPWRTSKAIGNVANPNTGQQFVFSYNNREEAEFYLVTPAIDLTKAVDATLEFSHVGPIGIGQDKGDPIYVKYSESATGPWTLVYESESAGLLWQNNKVNLDLCSGKTVYLAFVHKDVKTTNFGVGIDDIKITAQISDKDVAVSSDIAWSSNTVEKDMLTTLDLTVYTSDNNSTLTGAEIRLTNINDTAYQYRETFNTSTYKLDSIRRGSYKYVITLDKYYDKEGTINIYEDATVLECMLEKKPEVIDGLYVSPTAWAKWEYKEANVTFNVLLDNELVAENITDKYYQLDVTSLTEGEKYTVSVRPNTTTENVIMEYAFEYTSCGDFAKAVNFRVKEKDGNAILTWELPKVEEETGPFYEFSSNFDNGTLTGWSTIDADGDKRNWQNTSEFANQGFGIDNTHCVASISYDNEDGAINPNNFLVTSKKYTITANSKLTFSVAAQSKNNPAEHYGVAISTKSNTKAEDFEMIFEETLTAGDVDSTSIQGEWFERTIDLNKYAGQVIYIAFRHFNSAGNFWINVDNIELTGSTTRGTAEEEEGDWLYYDNGIYESAQGLFTQGNDGMLKPTQIYWAIMFPADAMSDYANRTISKVSLYDNCAHKGAFSIHKGGDAAPGEMVHFQSYETTGKKEYVEFELDKSIKISGNDNIWIQFSNEYGSGDYPAAYSKDMGDPNSRWTSGDGSMWYDANFFGEGWYGTWMIRAYVDPFDETIVEEPEVTTIEPLGTIIFRDGVLITPEPVKGESFTDKLENLNIDYKYTTRVVYGGEKDETYYAMSCPVTRELKLYEELVCERPTGLYGASTLKEDGTFGATLVWPYVKKWLYYDDGKYKTAVGAGGNMYWGVMFPAEDLTEYVGSSITKIALFDIQEGEATLSISYGGNKAPEMTVHTQKFDFKGWTDEDAEEPEVIEVQLTSPIPVPEGENLWITIHQNGASYPAGATANTGDPNGRWCSLDGTTWGDILAMSEGKIDATFYLRAYASNDVRGESEIASRAEDPILDHYNVYRSTTNGNYQKIAETKEVRYFDEIAKGTYYYQVKAVYTRGEETCESEAALSHEDPTKDYIVVEVTTIDENGVKGMMIYPNPTDGNLNITAENMRRITIVNALGQMVYDREANADETIINMSQFDAGIYLVRITTENGVAVKRISVL